MALSGLFACNSNAHSLLPDRVQIDRWLRPLGASDKFDATKRIDWGLMPGPFYTPELGLGLGIAAVGIYRPDASDSTSQNSTMTLSGYVSSTGALGLNFNNYTFYAGDRWRFFLDGTLNNTPAYFWGQGFAAGDDNPDKQKYRAQALALKPVIYRRLTRFTYLGIGWSLDMLHAANSGDNRYHRIEQPPQGASSLSSGASAELSWDNRDFVPNPRSGQQARIRYTHYAPETGSDTRFEALNLHYSHYHPLTDSSVLAWELYGEFTQGQVPWNMLAQLGNSHRMRGYYAGRYRDKNVISGQLELRKKLSWRHGIVAWLGAGTMSPSFHQLNNGRWLPSTGVGYRFEFKPRMNIRLDYGIGKSSSGFYFQVGEAF
ncbi:BamA/TamA family outer membrane protein [Erwinia sp. OLCASP19]|uniref:BamA/TamA family outer membrane protein n=1 Tax=unclassified Erwinia TaxID=2622719 RepID=UPI00406D401A